MESCGHKLSWGQKYSSSYRGGASNINLKGLICFLSRPQQNRFAWLRWLTKTMQILKGRSNRWVYSQVWLHKTSHIQIIFLADARACLSAYWGHRPKSGRVHGGSSRLQRGCQQGHQLPVGRGSCQGEWHMSSPGLMRFESFYDGCFHLYCCKSLSAIPRTVWDQYNTAVNTPERASVTRLHWCLRQTLTWSAGVTVVSIL